MEEYTKLDDTITESMLAAERELPERQTDTWTTELKEIMSGIRYLRLVLRWYRGQEVDPDLMRKVQNDARIEDRPADVPEILSRLQKQWKRLTAYNKEREKKQEEHMAQCLKESV